MILRAISLTPCDEIEDEKVALELRVLKPIYGALPPYRVMFEGDNPLREQDNRDRVNQWCSKQGVRPSDYLLTPKRSVYFQSETDAMMCRLYFA